MSPLVTITGDQLLAKEFPPMRWAVPGLIPEGLTELGGSPKVGKSWMMLDVAASIATGDPVFGGIDVEAGDVLYLALEDGQRRLQGRLNMILGDRAVPERLTLATGATNAVEAFTFIMSWLGEHPDARLVVVDVFAKIRPQSNGKRSAYEEDYAALAPLQEAAISRGIAILLVTHLRKAAADDVFAEISGSAGMTGAADAVLIVKRQRNETDAAMHLTGRDVAEGTFEMECGADMRWRLAGGSLQTAAERAEEARQTAGLEQRSAEVVRFVNEHPDGITPKDLEAAGIDGLDYAQGKTYLSRLAKAGRIAKADRGVYTPLGGGVTSVALLPDEQLGTPVTSVTLLPEGNEVTEVTPPFVRARGGDPTVQLPGETEAEWEARLGFGGGAA